MNAGGGIHMNNFRQKAITLGAAAIIGCTLSAGISQDSIQYRLLKTPEYLVFEDGVTPRERVRANYYRASSQNAWDQSPGQVSIEYGLPQWKDQYDALFEQLAIGKRWRLGSNYWTNLSLSFPIEAAGRKIKAGYYFLVMEHASPKGWDLVVLEPAEMTRRQLDPYHVYFKDTGPGIHIPLEWERVGQVSGKLKILLKLNDANPKQMSIHIYFGKHHFVSSPLTVQF
jgi:hypothetical protein